MLDEKNTLHLYEQEVEAAEGEDVPAAPGTKEPETPAVPETPEAPEEPTEPEPAVEDFSYDPAQLGTNKLYQVRFRIGDTVAAAASFLDSEIQFALDSVGGSVVEACIFCVTAMLSRVAQKGDGFSVGPYSETGAGAGSLAYWQRLLDDLKASKSNYSAPQMAEVGQYIFHYGMMGGSSSDDSSDDST